MKTLLVSGTDQPPDELREIVAHGSTSLDEVSGDDLVTYVSRQGLGVDRIVFWDGRGDEAVRALAVNYATAAGTDRAQTVFYVTATPAESTEGLSPEIVFTWPRDEDKLKMVFMTGG